MEAGGMGLDQLRRSIRIQMFFPLYVYATFSYNWWERARVNGISLELLAFTMVIFWTTTVAIQGWQCYNALILLRRFQRNLNETLSHMSLVRSSVILSSSSVQVKQAERVRHLKTIHMRVFHAYKSASSTYSTIIIAEATFSFLSDTFLFYYMLQLRMFQGCP